MNNNRSVLGANFLYITASLVITLVGLRLLQPIIIPILFALFLAMLGSAPLAWLRKIGVPKIISVLMVASMVIILAVTLGIVLWSSAHEFATAISGYSDRITNLRVQVSQYLGSWGIKEPDSVLKDLISYDAIKGFTGSIIQSFASTISKFVLVLVICIFMLIEAADLKIKLQSAFAGKIRIEKLAETVIAVRNYLGIKSITCLISGLVVYSWVSFMGLDLPKLWGILSFTLHYIPYIGTILAAVPAVLLGTVQMGFSKAIILAIGYVVLHHSISDFIEPWLMGRKLGVSPMVVFLSLIFWGFLWGPAGAFMAVPLTMMVKIFLEHSTDFSWVAMLLDKNPRKKNK